MALLEVKNLGISFGGLRAVDEFPYGDRTGTALWSDWSERRGKNHGLQSADRCV